jgi:LPS export ABC transporter permease LptF
MGQYLHGKRSVLHDKKTSEVVASDRRDGLKLNCNASSSSSSSSSSSASKSAYYKNIWFRYLFSANILPFIVSLFAFTFVIWITQAINVIELIFNHGAPIKYFLQLSLYLVPYIHFIIFPIVSLCGVLYVTRKMWHDNELTMFQCFGLSHSQIMRPFFLFGVLCCMIHYFIALYLMPVSYQQFNNLEHKIKNHYMAVLLEEGTFTNKVQGLTFYVDKKVAANKFSQIFLYDTRDKSKNIILSAEYGSLVQSDDGKKIHFILHNGSYQEEGLYNHRNSILFFKNHEVEVDLSTISGHGDAKMLDANARYLDQMLWNIGVEPGSAKYKKILVYGHQRIVWPLYNLIVVLLTLAIVLCKCCGRRSYHAFSLSFFMCFVAMLLNFVAQNAALRNNIFIFVFYVLIFVFLCMIFYLLKQGDGEYSYIK